MIEIFRKILAPKNSIILLADSLTFEKQDLLEAEISRVKKYYKIVNMSDILSRKNKAQGLAAIVFKYPRQSLLQFSIPYFLHENIPFNIALDPDLIGLTRLPGQDKIEIQKANPLDFSMTWGKLIGLSTDLFEFGLFYKKKSVEDTLSDLNYLKNQLKRTATFVFSEKELDEKDLSLLNAANILGAINEKEGIIEAQTDSWQIPVFTKI